MDEIIERTSLMWTARLNENPKVISLLLEVGADVNARDANAKTPLIWAAIWDENPEVIS